MLRAAVRWGLALYGDRAPGADPNTWTENGGPTLGQLADLLGVRDCGDGLDIGGPAESPEAFLKANTDGDGNVDDEALTTL